MQKHYNYLDIDLDSKNYRKLRAMQGDIKSRYILVNLYSNNLAYDLSHCTVKIYGLKRDKTIFFNNAVVKNAKLGQFEIELTNQALAVPGELKVQILVLGTDGEKLTSSAFFIDVGESIIDENAIESTNEFGALTESLTKVNEWNGYFEETSGKIEEKYTERLNNVDSQLEQITKDIIPISSKIMNGKKIKLIGDSITAGVGGTGYNPSGEEISGGHKVNTNGYCWANELKKYFETNFSCVVKNFGINGLNSRQLANNITDFIRAEDDIVICCIGTNNRLLEQGLTFLEEDIKTIYDYCKDNNKDIIFMSNIPASTNDESGIINGTKYSTMQDIDNTVMKVCSNLGIEYISLYKLFSDYIDYKSISLSNCLTSDGLHPNDYGYGIMFNIILGKLGFSKRKELESVTSNYYLDTPTSNNADDFLQSGRYVVNVNSVNFPLLSSASTSNSTEGELQVYNYKDSNSYVLQTYFGLWGGIAQRSKINGTWGSWYEIEGDTGWKDLTLESGFTSRGTDFKPQYRKVGKTVYLRGQISGNFTTSSTPIFQLPAGCRPTMEHVYRAFHESNYLTGNIIKNGYLSAFANTNFTGYLVLDYITPFLVG